MPPSRPLHTMILTMGTANKRLLIYGNLRLECKTPSGAVRVSKDLGPFD